MIKIFSFTTKKGLRNSTLMSIHFPSQILLYRGYLYIAFLAHVNGLPKSVPTKCGKKAQDPRAFKLARKG